MNERFTRAVRIVITALVVGILVVDGFGYLPFLQQRNIRINAPVSGFTYAPSFVLTGDAWTPSGLPPVDVTAVHPASGKELQLPATRLTVRYRGIPVEELAIYQARVTLPEEGTWQVRSLMRDPSGGQPSQLASETRTITVRSGASDHLFVAFSTGHLIAFGILAVLSLAVVLRYRRQRSQVEVRAVSLAIGLGMLVAEFSYHIYWVLIDGFSASNSLMLHMCGISLLVFPYLLFMRPGNVRQWLFEISWFWGIGGALNAYVAPDIWTHSFPELRFFTFFITHGLLVLGTLFFALTSGMQLTRRSLLRAAAVTFGFAALIWGVDQIPRLIPPYEPANYFMIAYPPPTGSIIDVFADIFGPSPAYGIGLVLLGLVLFAVLYAPFPILRRARARRARP